MKTFDVYSGMIRISDPCFDAGAAKVLTLKAKKGRWVAEVEKEEKVAQDIIKTLVAYFDEKQTELAGLTDIGGDYNKALSMMLGRQPEQITQQELVATIESGQIGIFDNKSFGDNKIAVNVARLSEKIICEDQPWYSICCDRVLSEDQWGSLPNGCVTSSTVDGDVAVSTHTNACGEVVKVEINFEKKVESSIPSPYDEDEEEEWEEDEECDCEMCRGEVDDEDDDDDDDDEEEEEEEEDDEEWEEIEEEEEEEEEVDEDDDDEWEDEEDEDDDDEWEDCEDEDEEEDELANPER